MAAVVSCGIFRNGSKNKNNMKDAYKFLTKIDTMLEKERNVKSDKMDSILCFGGNTDGSASVIHAQPGMIQAIIVNEMVKEKAVAEIILQAAATYQALELEQKKKTKIIS